MKIVQTFWSCNKPNLRSLLAHKAGWPEASYHYMSWALSCLQARKYYNEVELVTDQLGRTLLIDHLQLPYTNVRVVLDEQMAGREENLWALPKIIAYRLQTKPFIHIDGDVLLFKAFEPDIEQAPLIAQNLEIDFPIYHEALVDIDNHFTYLPATLRAERQNSSVIMAANTGSFGGHNLDFIQNYTKEALRFVDENALNLHRAHPVYINCVFEQYLLHCLSKQADLPITYLFDGITDFNQYMSIAKFIGQPTQFGYVHPVGPFKQHPMGCRALERQLRTTYPDTYYRLLKVLNQRPIRVYFYQIGKRLQHLSGQKKQFNPSLKPA